MKKETGLKQEHQEALENVGKRLRLLRLRKGYQSHETFAYDNKIARSQYGRYEAGENMKMLTLMHILDIHGVTLEEFFQLPLD